MCLLFFNADSNPEPNGFRLILANNRDETYTRPTKEAGFWDKHPRVIGGMDMYAGKEGGTWLAMSKAGRIGVLLNILQPVSSEASDARGRGYLVTDFVTDELSGLEYLSNVQKEAHEYNRFNMVTIELKKDDKFDITHYSNLSKERPLILNPGTYGFGNSLPECPFRKLKHGTEKFNKIVKKNYTVDEKDSLMDDLLSLLTDDTKYHPDSQIASQGEDRPDCVIEGLSAICVKVPQCKYGTRTNTVILVDSKGKVDYLEKTMVENSDPYNPTWVINRHQFDLELDLE